MLPFDTLFTTHSELGLVVSLLVGVGFGFALERAGFGRSSKLAAQFYLRDLTVFKVMFSAIVTAMLGVVIAGGLGVVDLKSLSEGAASETFAWPMAIGGFLLGIGFVVSGYCPGTSVVSSASGHVDGMVALVGVIAGTVIYGEVYPAIADFATSGAQGPLFLYDVFGVSPAVLAVGVAVMALGMFFGADAIERRYRARVADPAGHLTAPAGQPRPRRAAFGALATGAAAAFVVIFVPVGDRSQAQAGVPQVSEIGPEALAARVIEAPWRLRVLDVRNRAACAAARVLTAECAPLDTLAQLGLEADASGRDLVLVAAGDLAELPPAVAAAKGRVFVLAGGFAAWQAYALKKPVLPGPQATAAERAAYEVRAGLSQALTGLAAPPPPAAAAPKGAAGPKKKGGGCQ